MDPGVAAELALLFQKKGLDEPILQALRRQPLLSTQILLSAVNRLLVTLQPSATWSLFPIVQERQHHLINGVGQIEPAWYCDLFPFRAITS
jgi:hypothetical protein